MNFQDTGQIESSAKGLIYKSYQAYAIKEGRKSFVSDTIKRST